MAKYKNIPVDEETYLAVKTIAVANGLGERGIGAQVRQWVTREIAVPVCEHPKQPVEVQIFPSPDYVGGTLLLRAGWFCPTCNRVYDQNVATKQAVPA